MADYTNTGYQANVNTSKGGFSQLYDSASGRWVDEASPEGQRLRKGSVDAANKGALAVTKIRQDLADAEVNADAQDYEARQNQAQSNQAFQYALSQAGGRRQPGGGVARSGGGRRGMTLNSATGGLAAANAAARRTSQGALAKARVNAQELNRRMGIK